MYQVPDAISSMQQQHLVQAVVIADMLQVEYVAQQALQALSTAAGTPQGLALEPLQALASLETWPVGLKQLLPSLVKNTASAGTAQQTLQQSRQQMQVAACRTCWSVR
jgi:hypothetical protein